MLFLSGAHIEKRSATETNVRPETIRPHPIRGARRYTRPMHARPTRGFETRRLASAITDIRKADQNDGDARFVDIAAEQGTQ